MGTHAGAHSHTYAHAGADSYAHTCAYPGAHSHTYAHARADSYAHMGAHPHPGAGCPTGPAAAFHALTCTDRHTAAHTCADECPGATRSQVD